MRRYKFERQIVRPTLQTIQATIRLAEVEANRTRERGQVDASQLVRFWNPKDGARREWAVPSYQWIEGHATPTFRSYREGVGVLGVAWWYDAAGDGHLRIVSEDCYAETVALLKREVREWGLLPSVLHRTHPVTFVYPELFVDPSIKWEDARLKCVWKGLYDDPLDAASWSVLHDLCADAGRMLSALYASLALHRLALLGLADSCPCHPESKGF